MLTNEHEREILRRFIEREYVESLVKRIEKLEATQASVADLERKVARLLDERMKGLEARDDAQRRSMGLG